MTWYLLVTLSEIMLCILLTSVPILWSINQLLVWWLTGIQASNSLSIFWVSLVMCVK